MMVRLNFKLLKAIAGEPFRAIACSCSSNSTVTKLQFTSYLMQGNPKVMDLIPNSTIVNYKKLTTQPFIFNQRRISNSNNKSKNFNELATDNFVLERFYSSKADKIDQGGNKVVGQLHFNMTEYNIVHNKKDHYFYIILKEGSPGQDERLAKLEYALVKPGLADLFHTEVPPEFQGKGIAKQLVLAGLDALCEENIFIRPTCPYVQKVLRENPVQQHLNHIEKGFKL